MGTIHPPQNISGPVSDRPAASAWLDRANCVGHFDDMFPERGKSTVPGKTLCAGCPLDVRQACADDELVAGLPKVGIRAGMSERQRRGRRVGDPVPDPVLIPSYGRPVCGTQAALYRHRRDGEHCETCLQAERDRAAEQRRTMRERNPRVRKVQPCGTDAAYRRHKKAGEPACAPCVEAHRAAEATRRRAFRAAETERNRLARRLEAEAHSMPWLYEETA
jgi:hypothetical protein